MHPQVAIILVNWNGKKDSRECLTSLQKIKTPIQIYLVDNGSTDHSLEELMAEFPNAIYIDTGKNCGFAGGNNYAIRLALDKGAEFCFLLNNDTIVDPNIVESLLEAAEKKPRGGIFGAKSFSYFEKEKIDHFGGIWRGEIAEFVSIGKGKRDIGFDLMQKVDYVCGCAMMVRKEVFEKIGLLDERFFLLWEESDFCMRARRAGYEIWTVPKAHLHHKISSSFEGKAQSHYYWWRGRLLFLQKNVSLSLKSKIFWRLFFDGCKEMRHFFVKGTLLYLSALFHRKSLTSKRIERWKRNKAAVIAISDFVRKRFGGPKVLNKKEKSFLSKRKTCYKN